MNGSINYQVNQIWNQLDRIGNSKKDERKSTENKGANGHKVSEFVHGIEYKNDIIQIAKELGNFAKETFKIKDMQKINNDVVAKFIHDKIEDGISNATLKTYISKLEKVHIGLSKIPKKMKSHNDLFDRNIFKELRKDVDRLAIRKEHNNRAYINPEAIISRATDVNNIAGQLQLKHGLRAHEATNIKAKQMLENNQILINGKGGFTRIIKPSLTLYNAINQHIKENGSFFIKYNDYSKNLASAIDQIGENKNGTHGLRYNFAQTKLLEYSKTMSYEKALIKTSNDLGHKRAEITKLYLK